MKLKLLYTLLLVVIVQTIGFGQALTGNYTISTSNPDNNFKTLVAAVSRLKIVGMSGPVNFLLDENQSVASQIVIDQTAGTSTTNILTIKPNNGKNVIISGSVAGSLIAFNGADNVIIDGNNSSENNRLKIQNTYNASPETNKAGIMLYNGSNNNIFRNLTIELNIVNTTKDVYTIGIFSGGNTLGTAGNNSNNTVSNIIFTNVSQAVYVEGNTDNNTANWTISDNTMGSSVLNSKPALGIYLNNVNGYTINKNVISGIRKNSNYNNRTASGITSLGSSTGGVISNNIIKDIENNIFNNGSSTAGIFIQNTGSTSIYNNIISNVYNTGSDSSNSNFHNRGHGIFISSGGAINIYYNTIEMTGAPASTTSTSCLYLTGGTSVNIRNNIFLNKQSSQQYAIFKNGGTTGTISNNDYYVTNSTNSFANRNNSTDYIGTTGLSSWNTAVSDSNSIVFLPTFVASPIFHLDSSSNSSLKNAIPITLVTTDIDNTLRDSTKPYMGADEICSAPATPSSITQPTNKCSGTSQTFSISAVSGATSYNWSATGTGWSVTGGGATISATITIGTGVGVVTVTAINSCGTSSAATTGNITPTPPSIGGTVAGGTSVCPGTNSTVLTLSGHTGSIVRWESSLNNFSTAGTTINNTTTTLTATNLTAATSYRAVLQSGSCAIANSTPATITITVPAGDQTSYANNAWIGYVYASTNGGNPPSNVFTTNYVGYVNQPETFDSNLGSGSLTGTNLCGSYSNNFSVRYKMNKTLTAGYYTFTVGGDDGYRLSVDGGSTYIITGWSDHGYLSSTQTVFLSGNTNFVLEYFENAGDSRLSFAYTFCPSSTAPTAIAGVNSICGGSSTTLTATGGTLATGSVYQWGTGTTIGNNIISGQTGVSLAVNPSATTVYWVRIVDCTNKPTTGITQTVTLLQNVVISPFSPSTSTRCQEAKTITTTTTANNATAISYSLDAATLAFTGNSINTTTGAVTYAAGWSGTTTITASAAGCNGPVTTTHVVTTNIDSGGISLNGSAPYPLDGNTVYCANSTAVFSVPDRGATSYNWIYPSDWTPIGAVNERTLTVMTSNQSGPVYVTADNVGCSSSLLVTLSTVKPNPTLGLPTLATCTTGGSFELSNLPAGTWSLERTESNITKKLSNKTGTTSTTLISDLTEGNYYFKIRNDIGCESSEITVPIKIKSNTWNGSTWSSNTPKTPQEKIIFNESGDITEDVEGCSCEVASDKLIKIASGKVLKLQNGLTVLGEGKLTFENGASLIQENDDPTINTGNIIYKRTTSEVQDLDYVYWSSPVKDQIVKDLSPASTKFHTWFVSNWAIATPTSTMKPARGYIIQVPKNTAEGSTQKVDFIGVPNNGTIEIQSQGANKKNLIGNPYPSAIDAEQFMIDNQDIIGSTLYFWTHKTAQKAVGAGNVYVYSSNDYATFNLSGTTKTGTASLSGSETPTEDIPAGQSFFVVSKKLGNFTFNNDLRIDVSNRNTQFYKQSKTKKTTAVEKNRVWLNMTNDGGAFKQLLVGYIEGATNGDDNLYDGTTINGNTFIDFYSIANEKNYTVQGRSLPFDNEDSIPLGYKTTIEGTFKISIDKVDGAFKNQEVFLEDKLTNTIHNLNDGSYSFTTAIGTFGDRFVLRYKDTSKTLGTDDNQTKGKGVIVSVKNSQIKVSSFDQSLTSVNVYDLKGSLLYQKNKLDTKEFIIDQLNSSNQFMVVMVQLENGKWVSEEIIFHE